MNEEELFCKLFPEYVVNGKPLSPYFDLFESGYEQSEKRIAELEQKLTEKVTLESLDVVSSKISELEKENAELKEKLNFSTQYYQGEKAKDNLTKAKDLLNEFLDFESSCMERGIYISDKIRAEAEQFLKDSEVEK